MHNKNSDTGKLRQIIEGKLSRYFGRTLGSASEEEIFQAVALSLRDRILERAAKAGEETARRGMKTLYYLSAEFLLGRALVNSMINLGVLDEYRAVLDEIGYPLDKLEEQENEAGLGNGGLGRLAACFLDSLSTLNMPVIGFGIRYEYGIFRQRLVDGRQVEVPDDWTAKGDVWGIERRDEQVEVRFEGTVEEVWSEQGLTIHHRNYQSVLAVPYDMPVIGYDSKMPATLRLWSAECPSFDLELFNKGDYDCLVQQRELAETISKVLYPEDNHIAGRMLRLKQYYFLASATMQHMVREHKKRYGDVRTLPDKVVVQINDTHPAFAIPELMRILMDEEKLSWNEAYDIVSRIFNYTNHTVMQEALEVWPKQMFKALLPRVYAIVAALNDRFSEKLWKAFPGDWDKISAMSIIAHDEIRMPNMCLAVCNRVNGVSQLHGDILKTRTFRDYYVISPEKFVAITNGITQRRWLAAANPALCGLIHDYIGGGFLKDSRELERLRPLVDNPTFIADFARVKEQNKRCLAEYVKKTQGVALNPETVFDVQAKRLHEYKRQLLKVLHILYLYNRFSEDASFSLLQPVTFLFAAKASPAYHRAKSIIHLINAVAALVESNPRTREAIRVQFLENYNVTLAERLIPAADISEQLSTAGREASGTGNMKFMLNGAVTLGTMDGANVEIFERVGPDNIYIFGARAEEIARMERDKNYDPRKIFDSNPDVKAAVSRLIDGSLPGVDVKEFEDIYRSLLIGDYDPADRYFVLYDFDSYREVFNTVMGAYADRAEWTRKAALNTASAGFFSSDRTVAEYSRLIWHLESL